jgi:hypothetical protein
MKKSKDKRLEFGAAFNQFIKRSDSKTIISVVDNTNDASIYAIYVMKRFIQCTTYDGGPNRGMPKDFNKDSEWRLGEMQKRTRGFIK